MLSYPVLKPYILFRGLLPSCCVFQTLCSSNSLWWRRRRPGERSWPGCYVFVLLGPSFFHPSQDERWRFIFKSSITQTWPWISLPHHLGTTPFCPGAPVWIMTTFLSAINLRVRQVVFHALSCAAIWSRCISLLFFPPLFSLFFFSLWNQLTAVSACSGT